MPPAVQPFRAFAAAHGVKSLSATFSPNTAKQLLAGKLPNNHPYRADFAARLGVGEAELTPYCGGRPLSDKEVKRLAAKLAAKKTAVVVHPTESNVARRRRALAGPGRRNSLKRQRLDLREAVRGMLTTTNVAIMQGERYVPNIPTEALYLVLTDYAERRGIKIAVVLNPKFAEVFD